MATHEARLAAEEPRCQALDCMSVRFVAGLFPGICPGIAAGCVTVCGAGFRISLLLDSMLFWSLFAFRITLDYEECVSLMRTPPKTGELVLCCLVAEKGCSPSSAQCVFCFRSECS